MVKELFKKSKHFLIQKIGYFLNDDMNKIILTKTVGVHTLGLYNMGKNLGNIIPLAIIPQVAEVFYTTVNSDKTNKEQISDLFYKFTFRLTILSLTYALLTYFFAPILAPIILTEKWNGVIVIIQLVSIYIPLITLGNIFNRLANIYGYFKYYTYSAIILPIVVIPSTIYITNNYSIVFYMKFLISLQLIEFIIMFMIFLNKNYIIEIKPKLFYLIGVVYVFNITLLGVI
jgi:O-antigen/teichoic acid export membrane protein